MNRFAILACVAGCGSSPPRPATAAAARCEPPATADTPLVVLYESNPFVGTHFPSVAIWADGAIIGQHAEYGTTTAGSGHIDPHRAEQIADEVRRDLAGLPDRSAVSTATDEPSVRVVMRDGSAWRIVSVYGFTARSAEPVGMAAAVKRLKEVRERLDATYAPPQWALAFDEYEPPPPGTADDQPVQEETRPWPEGLPVPRASGEKVVIDAKLYPLVERLDDHPALRGGTAWRVDATALFRGEQVVDAVERCAWERTRPRHPL